MDANQLRNAFTKFFEDRDHRAVASSSLIPHHPLAPLFTNAGMNQFLPYFLDEEKAPFKRATTIQKCVRVRGKHDDIENVGVTSRHLTFFEMMGNFSFGDYFKEQAIKQHWELFTDVLGLNGDDIWITVHHSDDAAAEIWRDTVGVPAERIQRMGEDNFWEMGDTGPCGPCSELYIDRGPQYGEAGGPAEGGDERYRELGNLVFMEFDRKAGGVLQPLPNQNIDTGSGFERLLSSLEQVESIWDTSALRPIITFAESLTGKTYGKDEADDIKLRIMADHGRCITFLVNDGVFPSNEDRGYVLRRIARRMFRTSHMLGAPKQSAEAMVDGVCQVMGEAYPDIVKNKSLISEVLGREEDRFHKTLASGSALLDQALEESKQVSGPTAFALHDTFGFPIELTREIARERDGDVDMEGFEQAMERQRTQAREAAKANTPKGVSLDEYRALIDANGQTNSLAYTNDDAETVIVGVLQPQGGKDSKQEGFVEIFLRDTPFYAERGGQVGDTGHITTDTGTARVEDTTWAVPGLVRHLARIVDGRIETGQDAHAVVDAARRNEIRRNHTGTHILHWAFREVLGHHVKQSGSLVAPDRLRFDFSHYQAVTAEELAAVERLANQELLTNGSVEATICTYEEAMDKGAIAFFGEKYDALVRMVQAGEHSLELCGGTHVHALGDIGPIKIISEASIGSNLRRIEALTGEASLDHMVQTESTLARAAAALKAKPTELETAIEKTLAKSKALEDQLKSLRAQSRKAVGAELLAGGTDGVVVSRVDDTPADELRELALDVRDLGAKAVVLIGSPDGAGVALVAATQKASNINAGELVGPAAKTVGGGGGKGADFAMAGGRNAAKIDEALDQVRSLIAGS